MGEEEKLNFVRTFPTLDEPDHIPPSKSIFIQNTLCERVDGVFVNWYEEYTEKWFVFVNFYMVFIPYHDNIFQLT